MDYISVFVRAFIMVTSSYVMVRIAIATVKSIVKEEHIAISFLYWCAAVLLAVVTIYYALQIGVMLQ